MAKSVDQLIDDVLRREGGFVNDPDDRGGATNMGITQETLSRWLGREATVEDVRNLDEPTARAIYRTEYYHNAGIDKLPGDLQPFLFDAAVNHGPGGAAQILQRSLRKAGHPVAVDGAIGMQTVAAAQDAYARLGGGFYASLIEDRRNFYHRIAQSDPSQRKFLPGWMSRIAEFDQAPRCHA